MQAAKRRKRLRLPLVLAGALVMALAALLTYFGLARRTVALSQIRFPVLTIPPDESNVFVAADARALTQAPIGANNTPATGTIVIDSNFNIYSEQHVKCDQGGAGMLFRTFVRPRTPLSFTFDLRQHPESGLAPALQRVMRSASELRRPALSTQETLQGIITILQQNEP